MYKAKYTIVPLTHCRSGMLDCSWKFRSFDKPLRTFFIAYSKYIHDYWWIFIVSSFICSAVLSCGLIWIVELNITDADYICTPTDAQSYKEEAIVAKLWPHDPSKFQADRSNSFEYFSWIILESKEPCMDEGKTCNMLDKKYLTALLEIDEFIVNNITTSSGKKYSDLCLNWYGNCPRFKDILQQLLLLDQSSANITFPTTNIAGLKIYLGYSLGGVTTIKDQIIMVKAVRMTYFLRDDSVSLKKDSLDWEQKMQKEIDGPDSNIPNITRFSRGIFHSRSVDQGVHQNLLAAIPILPCTIAVLLSFSIPFLMVLKDNPTNNNGDKSNYKLGNLIKFDWVRSKPLLAPIGLLTAGMGIGSGMGTLMWFGYEFPDASIVTPFLVLSIGVDDMFILVNSWQISDRSHSVHLRIAHCLSEAAVAITITSITDSLSFFIGCLSTIPAVRYFCIHAGMCIVFNYIYQITFFVSVMVLFGKFEHEKRLCFLPYIKLETHTEATNPASGVTGTDCKSFNHAVVTISTEKLPGMINNESDSNVWMEPVKMSSQPDVIPIISNEKLTEEKMDKERIEIIVSNSNKSSSMGQLYGLFILHPTVKVFIAFLYVVFICLSIIGCINMNEGLDYKDLLMPQNPFINYLRAEQELFSIGPQAGVVVSKCPNLNIASNREQMAKILDDFEANKYVVKGDSHFWLKYYDDFLMTMTAPGPDLFNSSIINIGDWDSQLDLFFDLENETWSQLLQDIAFDEKGQIKAFRFRISLTKINTPDLWKDSVQEIRQIAEKYYQFEVTTYGGIFWKTADQYMAVIPNTLITTGIAMVCMVVVSVLLIPNPICSFWIGLTVVSIDIGVVGFMSLWNINLDYIAMITIIMSIGFSVDFAAHITYGYVCSDMEHGNFDSTEKTIISLQKTGFPLFKAAASTVVGVSTLYFTGSNMLMIFMKTVLLVIMIGCFHALVFLPIVLSTCMPLTEMFHKFLKRNSVGSTVSNTSQITKV